MLLKNDTWTSEDAEDINHLQCYGELQVIASAVGQRTHGLQNMVSKGKSQHKHIYHSEAEKKREMGLNRPVSLLDFKVVENGGLSRLVLIPLC